MKFTEYLNESRSNRLNEAGEIDVKACENVIKETIIGIDVLKSIAKQSPDEFVSLFIDALNMGVGRIAKIMNNSSDQKFKKSADLLKSIRKDLMKASTSASM